MECAGGILQKPGSSDNVDNPQFPRTCPQKLWVNKCPQVWVQTTVSSFFHVLPYKRQLKPNQQSHIFEFPSHFLHLFLVLLMKSILPKTSYHRGNFLCSPQQSRPRGKIIMTQKTLIRSNQSLHVLLAYWVTLSITGLTAGADWEVRRSVR